MNPAPVQVTRIVRRMSGGSQAQLVEADDRHYYVAKFLGNPQGNRTLINECVASGLLSYIKVSTPSVRILQFPPILLSHPELNFVTGERRVLPVGSLHLGSRCPVNPEKTAIFDFLPEKLQANVRNLAEFSTMYVFDQWTGQDDDRQAIHVRDKSVTAGPNLRAYFIDNGLAFDGIHWELHDRPRSGLARRFKQIYSMLDMKALVEDAIVQIESIDENKVMATVEGVPSSWFAPGDRQCLELLLIKLLRRRRSLRPLIARHLSALDYVNAQVA